MVINRDFRDFSDGVVLRRDHIFAAGVDDAPLAVLLLDGGEPSLVERGDIAELGLDAEAVAGGALVVLGVNKTVASGVYRRGKAVGSKTVCALEVAGRVDGPLAIGPNVAPCAVAVLGHSHKLAAVAVERSHAENFGALRVNNELALGVHVPGTAVGADDKVPVAELGQVIVVILRYVELLLVLRVDEVEVPVLQDKGQTVCKGVGLIVNGPNDPVALAIDVAPFLRLRVLHIGEAIVGEGAGVRIDGLNDPVSLAVHIAVLSVGGVLGRCQSVLCEGLYVTEPLRERNLDVVASHGLLVLEISVPGALPDRDHVVDRLGVGGGARHAQRAGDDGHQGEDNGKDAPQCLAFHRVDSS